MGIRTTDQHLLIHGFLSTLPCSTRSSGTLHLCMAYLSRYFPLPMLSSMLHHAGCETSETHCVWSSSNCILLYLLSSTANQPVRWNKENHHSPALPPPHFLPYLLSQLSTFPPYSQGSYIISSSFSGVTCASLSWDHNERVDSEKEFVTTRRKFILNTSKVVSSVTQICDCVCMYIVYARVESLTFLKL